MELAQKLYKCFSNENKRRILNIIKHFPVRHHTIHEVTGINEGLIHNYIKEFEEVGLIMKIIESRKRVYYSLPETYKTSIEPKKKHTRHELKINTGGLEFRIMHDDTPKMLVSGKYVAKRNRRLIPKIDSPPLFIDNVFRLFKFQAPLYKEDIQRIKEKNLIEKRYNNNTYDELDKIYKVKKALS